MTPPLPMSLSVRRLIAACMLWAFGVGAMAANCVVTVGWNDSPPHTFRAPDGSLQGIEVELVTAILRRMGCTPEFVELPLARALMYLETGQLDALPGLRRTIDREKFAVFSKPLFRSRNMLFLNRSVADKIKIRTLGDIAQGGFRLGVLNGAIYSDEYATLVRQPDFNAHLTNLVATTNGWQMMALNRLEGILADELTATYELRKLKLSPMVQRSIVISETEGRLAFSRKAGHSDLVTRFDKALDAMIKEQSYRAILEGFFHCKLLPDVNRCS